MRASAFAVYALWRREIRHFLRQPSRIGSAVGSPLLFWAVIGSGFDRAFQLPGGGGEFSFLRFFFPGTVVLLVLFAAIFSTISVIEDRQRGFLQGVLVAPVSRPALVAGKILGGSTLAWIQGLLVLPLAPLAGVHLGWGQLVGAVAVLALLSFGLTAIGFAFAWKVDSTQGFHAVMNLLLVPMWLLSGAFFPLREVPGWLGWLARINPLTYGMSAFRWLLEPEVGVLTDPFASHLVPVAVTCAFALLGFAVAVAVAWRPKP